MKKFLMTIVKAYKPLYSIYYYIGSFGVNIMKIFIKPQDNLILFSSFGGKKYDDSPKVIYEKMINDDRFKDYKFVWAFHDIQSFDIPVGNKIKVDTIEYYKTALKARCWITNSTIERGLNFKGKNTFYFNTWHGTPIKKMGSDISISNKSFKTKSKSKEDIMIAQSKYEADIFSRVFGIDRDKFFISGLPRNDELSKYEHLKIDEIYRNLNISTEKKIILYAPTFREFERDEQMNCITSIPMDLKKWKDELGDKYTILFRAHYEVSKIINIKKNSDFIKDVSDYPKLNDLMKISDILISDYSSIFFDYSILNRPMIAFTYDYEKYNKDRGMYFDIREFLPNCSTEEDLLLLIKNIDKDKDIYIQKTERFRNRYIHSYGTSTELCIDKIYKNISIGD